MAGAPALARFSSRASLNKTRNLLSLCRRCESKRAASSAPRAPLSPRVNRPARLPLLATRAWSTTSSPLRREHNPFDSNNHEQRLHPQTAAPLASEHAPEKKISVDSDPPVNRVPDEKLPSHREGQRWDLSKRFSRFMEDLMAKVAIASQKVNNYTGTDFSGIEALRQEIKEQEALVKARHAQVLEAKAAYDAAHAQQAASQKEVVGLLERKNSWGATDLERYMSLIRSEHLNDQAVQAAKDKGAAAERALEEARTRLEQRERSQYHEEQIWSDTIRRNSTWVTIGLMGVNITLLLASLLIIEPWRRRRLVREIRSAFEENKSPAVLPLSAAPLVAVPESDSATARELPTVALEQIQVQESPALAEVQKDGSSREGLRTATPTLVDSGVPAVDPLPAAVDAKLENDTHARQSLAEYFSNVWLACRLQFEDLLGEQRVFLRRIDITAVAVGGAAVGWVMMGVMMTVLLRR